MKKYGLIIVFLIASCAQEESEKVTVSFFDGNNGKIWYYGYTYEQFTNEDYFQFIKNLMQKYLQQEEMALKL